MNKKLNIGDYVRTKDGYIAKYLGYEEDKRDDEYSIYSFDGYIRWDYEYHDNCVYKGDFGEWFEDYVLKTSPNIIDLIEVGDYVNGKKVIDTFTDYIFDYSEEFKVVCFSETDILHDVKHIKSIVTKEQFKSMEYKLED